LVQSIFSGSRVGIGGWGGGEMKQCTLGKDCKRAAAAGQCSHIHDISSSQLCIPFVIAVITVYVLSDVDSTKSFGTGEDGRGDREGCSRLWSS